MSIASGKSHPTYLYNLCGIVQCPDSQVSWDHSQDELSWSSHVHSIHSRANSTLGFLRRNLRRCPVKLKETAYITLVRSTLKYAASIWDPHLAKDCDLLEKLQRRSARFVKWDYRTTSSVWQMLYDLGWCDLKDRRRELRLALLYKNVTGHVAINPDQIGFVAADNRTRANHRYKFRAIGASSTGLHYSFAVRTVSYWNQLPDVNLLLSRRIQLPSKLSWPDVRLFACHDPPPPLAWYSTRRFADNSARQDETFWFNRAFVFEANAVTKASQSLT